MNVKRNIAPFIMLLTFCVSVSHSKVKIDQLPMYGGLDRQSNPKLAAGDKEFVDKVLAEYADKRTGSNAFVDQGFRFLFGNNLKNSMRRFNQAWLLDESNPEVYHGFGAVLLSRENDCEAMTVMQKGLGLDWQSRWINEAGFLADLGYVSSLCVGYVLEASETEKLDHFKQIDKIYLDAQKLGFSEIYVYQKWWQSLYHRKAYEDAWAKIEELKEMGGEPSPDVLKLLKKQMQEPGK